MSSSSLQNESDFTLAHQVIITLAPAFSGTLSILGSSCIIWMLLAENRKKLKSVKYRFLFSLCLSDVFNSLTFVFWSLPIPKGTPGVWGAMGNKASCTAQGFLIQFGILGSFYNGALALYFYKSLCFNMKDEQIAKRYEKLIHIVSIVWCLGTATAGWQQDLYSFGGVGCSYASEPLRCHTRDDVDCIRGKEAYLYAWLYMGIPLFLISMYITYSMWMIYTKVKKVCRRAERLSIGMLGASVSNLSRTEVAQSSGLSPDRNIDDRSLHTRSQTLGVASQLGSISGNVNRGTSRYAERTKEAAWQAFLYVVAYVVTHMWGFVIYPLEQAGGTSLFFLLLVQNLSWPLHGFANVFIFIRPRINSIQKKNPEVCYFKAAYHSVFHYDEVRQRLTESVLPPARPERERQPTSRTTNASDCGRNSTGEENDASGVPATSGMNENRQENEERFQRVIHEEDSSRHGADEEPAIAEEADASSVPATSEMNENRQENEERFQRVMHEEDSSRHDADEEPAIAENAESAGPKGASRAKSVSFNDSYDKVK